MLTEAEKQEIIGFTANYAHALRECTTMAKEQAEMVVQLATSAMLGAVRHIPPPTDNTIDGIDKFVVDAIQVCLKREYDKVALQA